MGTTSANTETILCEECNNTVTPVTPPHPVYGDLTGGTVTQMNMITLGGMFGLNS